MKRIVLTGGPGAGKSVVCNALSAANPNGIVLVPEAATQVYEALGSRWDRMEIAGRRDAQRKIYALQVEQEARLAARTRADQILLLDRGTIDGAAYWPEGPEAYWKDLGTTLEAELRRYDAVILLETAAALGIYDGEASNRVRFEAPSAAIESGRVLERLWGGHPNFRTVNAHADIAHKIAAVKTILEEEGAAAPSVAPRERGR
ncbi:MAG TPA: ATP-binding protein [Tepidisphaeraceae bacterium]|nr:ATP-binding protein [Tepidisphaeraceae bacterium]